MVMFTRRYCIGPGLWRAAAFVGVATLLPAVPAMSQAIQLVKVDVAAVAKGFRAKKLLGSTVTNEKRESIGSLDDLVLDEKKQIFAVLQVGGFLGLGGHLIAVPYDSLKITEDGKNIELPGASRDALKALAEFHYSN
jgi:sporulation protein YlmC with PRC-barrel domain